MRNGKIAKMPEWVREKLNERLEKGESGKTILAWMNEEPYPGQKPIAGFDGAPISKQNLSQWRRGGFREWQMRREITAANSEMGDLGRTVEMAPLAENLLLRVMGHYAVLMSPWDGKPDEKFEAEVRILRGLLRDAALMQRAAGQADKLKEDIRRRKREREDLWGGGGLVEAMRETLRKQREERVEAELQRRADAMEGKDLAEAADCSSGTLSQATGTVTLPGTLLREDATAGQAGAEESGVVTVGQSESKQEVEVNAEAQRHEDAKGEKDLAEADCSSGTLSQATGTVTLPGTLLREDATAGQAGAGESEVVAVGQSESNQKAGLDSGDRGEFNAKAQTHRREDAMTRERLEDAKNEAHLGKGG